MESHMISLPCFRDSIIANEQFVMKHQCCHSLVLLLRQTRSRNVNLSQSAQAPSPSRSVLSERAGGNNFQYNMATIVNISQVDAAKRVARALTWEGVGNRTV
eukprot:scaffold4518_cov149-Cylindrotheca_fusiformis.AAC.18